MKHTVILEALADLSRQWHALNNGAKHVNARKPPHPEFWKDMLVAVVHAELALKKIRTAVRTQERKERRANCTHPEGPKRRWYSDGGSECRICGQKFPGVKLSPEEIAESVQIGKFLAAKKRYYEGEPEGQDLRDMQSAHEQEKRSTSTATTGL